MSKWKCQVCVGVPCVLECFNEPTVCPVNGFNRSKWEKVDDVPDSNPLPKLTTEVFYREDCPAWAEYAAVNREGTVTIFLNKPTTCGSFWSDRKTYWEHTFRDDRFDASDWQNSLIERPSKLPDWCKVGEWVFDKVINKYSQVTTEAITEHLQEVFKSLAKGEIVQSRLRPYTAAEMKVLVGKVIEDKKTSDLRFVAGYCNRTERIYAGQNNFNADLLLSDFTIDGQPCGVLEHLEDGEWVE